MKALQPSLRQSRREGRQAQRRRVSLLRGEIAIRIIDSPDHCYAWSPSLRLRRKEGLEM